MDSTRLNPEQVDKLIADIGRQLRYLTRLCERMQKLKWPIDDPLCVAIYDARSATERLLARARGAGPRPTTSFSPVFS